LQELTPKQATLSAAKAVGIVAKLASANIAAADAIEIRILVVFTDKPPR
jgi:hypothetical protein